MFVGQLIVSLDVVPGGIEVPTFVHPEPVHIHQYESVPST
jgi:hypothetical protein